MIEEWRSVVGYERLYEVSNQGAVRSLPRKGGNNRTYGGGSLALKVRTNGYLYVPLSREGKHKWVYVHKLVAEAFIGPRPLGMEVCHGPAGKLENSSWNLGYGTHQKNELDRLRDHTHNTQKLTAMDVKEARRRHAVGESTPALAKEYGVTAANMWYIVTRKTWRHI